MRVHHYLGALPKIGNTIRHAAAVDNQWLGLLSFSAPALRCSARDEWIGWSHRHLSDRLKLLANNSRFLILPEHHCPNLASRILSRCERRLQQDWLECFSQSLLLETFVDPARHRGTVYRASTQLRHFGAAYMPISGDFQANIEAVSPHWVIFPAGHRHDHPRKAAAEHYLAAGINASIMLRTDRHDDEGYKEWACGRIERHKVPDGAPFGLHGGSCIQLCLGKTVRIVRIFGSDKSDSDSLTVGQRNLSLRPVCVHVAYHAAIHNQHVA